MIITVSRQYGAGGGEVARRVAAELGWTYVDNEVVEEVARRAGLTLEEAALRDERGESLLELAARLLSYATPEVSSGPHAQAAAVGERELIRVTEQVVADYAARGRVVLVGRAAAAILGEREGTLHVRVVASVDDRVRTAAARHGLSRGDAEKVVQGMDARRAAYHKEHYGRHAGDAATYDLVVNTGRLGLEGAVAAIVAEVRRRGW